MRYFIILTVMILLLSGCGQTIPAAPSTATLVLPTAVPTVTASATPLPSTPTPRPSTSTPTAAPTPTAIPTPQHLVVCAQRPAALSPFTPSQAGHDILAFITTYPVEQVSYLWEPRLLTHIPSFSSGDVVTHSVSLQKGASYVDEEGIVRVHTGAKSLILTQLVVTYTLETDLKWSDSYPLTAKDVVFGFTLAQAPEAYGLWYDLAERTAALTAVDNQRVRWEGLPGFTSTNYPGFLFPPQPEHKWQELSLSEILLDRYPPVTGPYHITVWEDDASITLEPNPHYIGHPPQIDKIIVRFPQVKSNFWPEILKVGTCDVLLPGNNGNTNWEPWLRMIQDGHAVMWSTPSSTVLRLDFNLAPPDRRATPLGLTRTRLGLASCVSRDNIRELPLGAETVPAVSFIPPLHPADEPTSVWRVPYSIEVGQGVLDEMGWRDEDGDGIREAHGIEGIRDNTPLTLTLSTSTRHIPVAKILAADFQICGVGIIIDAKGPQQFYAASPVSPLYARDFQLALYGWRAEVPDGCGAWLSDYLPDNGVTGGELNYGGYNNALYDDACRQALVTVDIEQQYQAIHDAQAILSTDHATLFLTWQPRWLVSHPDVKGLAPDISTFGRIWNPEGITVEKE